MDAKGAAAPPKRERVADPQHVVVVIGPGRKLLVADFGRNPDVKLLDEELLHHGDQLGSLVRGCVQARRNLAQPGHTPFQLIRHRIVLRAIRPIQSDPSGQNRRDTLATRSRYEGVSEMSRRANRGGEQNGSEQGWQRPVCGQHLGTPVMTGRFEAREKKRGHRGWGARAPCFSPDPPSWTEWPCRAERAERLPTRRWRSLVKASLHQVRAPGPRRGSGALPGPDREGPAGRPRGES